MGFLSECVKTWVKCFIGEIVVALTLTAVGCLIVAIVELAVLIASQH